MLRDQTRERLVSEHSRYKQKFIFTIVLYFVFSVIADGGGREWAGAIAGFSCCFGIYFLIMYDSAYRSLKKYDKQGKVIIAQQPPSQIIQHHHYNQAPSPQQPPSQIIQHHQNKSSNALTPEFKLNYAKNLEKARNFEKAAEAYFELGLFEESARIRQTYLEKDTSTTVNIGKVGDTHINDSVVMNESTPTPNVRTCPFCQQQIENHWSVCPYCTTPF
ncbi:MAG: hypothetical protein VW230_03265 [Candidatus Poseidoniales archaeon]